MGFLFDPNVAPEDQGINQYPHVGPEENKVKHKQTRFDDGRTPPCIGCGRGLGQQHNAECKHFVDAEE